MNWINSVVRPKIRSFLRKKEIPDNLWVKCPETGQMIYYKDLEANQFVVPGSNFHMRMTGPARLKALFDDGKYAALHLPDVPHDPLKFRDERRYSERLKDARSKTGLNDAIHSGIGKLHGDTVVAAVQDFDFMGGSLGTAAGEAVISSMRAALVRNAPFILFAASGGARMQEGILSLMQMPRTTVAVEELHEANLPYIVVLTNPTTGGVTASYAMLGDIHIAEPGALIGFAGPRVIEQTIREQLPSGFQRSEYLLEHGMVDMVVHRHDLRATLARVCNLLLHRRLDATAEDQVKALVHRPAVAASREEDAPVQAQDAPAKHSGNGLDKSSHEKPETDEVLTQAPSNGANQQTSQNA
ncbi:acetyl-CoA carboxylase, carboxyltransferase subunit beta [Methyloceanibacter caenitepidi]|uniref:Acetyl-coenzyme A carboxylase carboxyl transferase subunit beta n=1 Tax=Methyloceanibacter caenitepidi TaxID=1384459 RepID=A0A0A8JZZ5_9HYPH|nr:acetyl-CoA carboxylase, carboxyltransferase subunit beta [Methyloceanibacter caenitepidi]BAQ16026.1 acetyl-coenzyme A carboxyl transferase beta chain [Methyloceanibacter caenitepidi]